MKGNNDQARRDPNYVKSQQLINNNNFYKEHENLKIECGFLKDRILDKKDIEIIAKLPAKEVLRAQVVMTLNSPIVGFVRTLKQALTKFVYCLDQIKTKKPS